MTYDQGREMARHERLSKKLCLRVYFADPHSPWQRGTNENTNGLLRQYLPKNADLDALSQRELNAIAARLNNRPRQTLNWMTPNEAWEAQLKSLNVALGT
jgi:IS30 family transposase